MVSLNHIFVDGERETDKMALRQNEVRGLCFNVKRNVFILESARSLNKILTKAKILLLPFFLMQPQRSEKSPATKCLSLHLNMFPFSKAKGSPIFQRNIFFNEQSFTFSVLERHHIVPHRMPSKKKGLVLGAIQSRTPPTSFWLNNKGSREELRKGCVRIENGSRTATPRGTE